MPAPNTTPDPIPAEDLTRQYGPIAEEIHTAIDRVLPSGKYTLGPVLEEFERDYARYCGVEHAIGISSGTAALQLALAAMGVGPGDEVITQANTYVATAFAISYLGATPVFVDVDPVYANLDVPGVIGRIGTLLGGHNVNIAGMQLGRQQRGGRAISAVNVDDPIPAPVLEEIRRLPNIVFAKLVRL